MGARRLPPETAKLFAANSAERLGDFIRHGVPDVLIGNEWVILWGRMVQAYGTALFEECERKLQRINDEIDDEENRSN